MYDFHFRYVYVGLADALDLVESQFCHWQWWPDHLFSLCWMHNILGCIVVVACGRRAL